MSYDKYKPAFDRDGFVIVKQLLDPAEFADVCRNLDRYIRDVVPTLPDKSAFYHEKGRPETLKQMQYMGCDPYFDAFRKNPKFCALAKVLLGEHAEAQEPEWFNKPPGTVHPTPPHQDNYYFCMDPPNVCTVWMAVDKVDDGNGCLRYVAGSYHHGVRPHERSGVLGFSQGITDYGPDDQAREVPIHLEAGDVVVHHGYTIHRAEPNRSAARNRRAFAMVFYGESCRRDEEAFTRYRESARQHHTALGLKV